MNPTDKTKKLGRAFLPVTLIDANDLNPNVMNDKEFNLLCQNVEKTGITDPILVRKTEEGRYRVIGGHHRLQVAKLYDIDEVPCTIIDDPDFDRDQENFQVVRMNMIRGKLDPGKFMKMYESLSQKYADDVMADSFGFAEEEQFQKLIKKMTKELPKELQAEFKEAAKEVKTIDGLAKLLNKMFTDHGDTLPFGYMVIDFGGKDSVWLRMDNKTGKDVLALGDICRKEKRTMDAILGGLIRLAANGKLDAHIAALVAASEEVDVTKVEDGLVTEEALAAA
jgi:hypothetical protein